ncbi:HAMP domain-containing histidine kinase [Clostridium sporogenes]|nr:HAMP domain-containing histidine kinase [Clostridium sporogenes]NFS26917.1 HAMP domain-containing histidine kinase [Clostridium sporogenes]
MKRKDIFHSTKRKVTIISTVIVFFCLFIFAIITTTLYKSRVFTNIDDKLFEQKNVIVKYFNSKIHEGNFLFNENRIPPPMLPKLIMIVYIEDKVYSINPNPYFDASTLPKFEDNIGSEVQRINHNGYEFRGITFRNNEFTTELLVNVDSEIQSISQLKTSIILGLMILIIVALILSYILSAKIIKPVKEAYDKQVFFVQDASHEMRTPLAVIKGRLEIMASSWVKNMDEDFEHISKIMSEIKSLEKLTSDLLLLSKEDIDININVTEFKLNSLISDLSEFYVDLAEFQNKKFYIDKPIEHIKVKWDYNKVKRMIIILLENAFKYTEKGGIIALNFQEINKIIKITVKDNGIGIKDEDQSRIFDRFFRSSDVRGKNINGSGIGLSLLRSISNTLGIKIKLKSKYKKGTEFVLIIPKIIK